MLYCLLSRSLNLYRSIYHYIFTRYNRIKLKNKDFSIIAKDCAGSVILHDLGLKFDTPTINLWFSTGDFLKFCEDMKYYLSEELCEDENTPMNYPVGILGSEDREIRIYFMHYASFSAAKAKWRERIGRIHWDNLYFIMTDREGCNEDLRGSLTLFRMNIKRY